MTNFTFNFSYPWLLFLLIPAVLLTLVPHFRIPKKYRRNRNRIISVVSHMTALVLSILLLSGLTFSYEIPNTKNEIILLVDASYSGSASREEKDDFIESVINICDDEYNVGVVKFGYDQVYAAPISADSTEVFEKYLESDDPDTTATDIESAIRYASTLFTNLETSKIVVISDGIETDGSVASVIKSVAAQGTRVDTVYFPNEEEDEVQIIGVETPTDRLKVDEHFVLGITLQTNMVNMSVQDVTINIYDNDVKAESVRVLMSAETERFDVYHSLKTRGMHRLRIEVESPGDTVTENNAYHTYMYIDTFDNILVIEKNEGESQELLGILHENNYEVTDYSVQNDFDMIPTTLKDLCEYEQVILVNMAYSDMPAGFERTLNEYVYSLGGGLLTVGGENETDPSTGELIPHAYNRADMEKSTYYKNMLPILTVDYTPPIAVVIVVDTSGSMSAEKLAAAKQGALGCLESLSDRDYCGVVSFASMATEEAEILPVTKREQIREAINKVNDNSDKGSDGTIFASALEKAGRALSVVDVERKHVILVTDGDPGDSKEEYGPFIDLNLKDGITMSIVAVECGIGRIDDMTEAAERGEGKFYNVKDYDELPAIMQRDLALEAIAEIEYGEEFALTISHNSSVVNGIAEADIPKLTGYYGTVAKDKAIVTLAGPFVPMYAHWKYGEGTVGSFMSDLNGTWSAEFINDPIGRTLVNNMVQSVFPARDVVYNDIEYVLKRDNYRAQLNVYGIKDDETVSVTVTPVISGADDLKVNSTKDNRRFTFEFREAGVYEITITKTDANGKEIGNVIVRDSFSYSQEYNEFPDKQPMGEELLENISEDGRGVVITDAVDVFDGFVKRLQRSYDPRFLFLIIAIVAVLIDIAVRKFKFKWPHELIREAKAKKEANNKK